MAYIYEWSRSPKNTFSNEKGCAFHFVEIQFKYCLYLQKSLETSAHAQLAITLLYILFANVLTWYQFDNLR